MRILLAYPVAEFSVSDVARGYDRAFRRAGHTVQTYLLHRRWQYHSRAIGDQIEDFNLRRTMISKHASESVLLEAMYFNADVVVIVSGLLFHPCALWLLHEAGIPTIAILTESPNQDRAQQEWAASYPGMCITTHERTSADAYGWHYLPHAYDPEFHRPVAPDPSMACDVLFVGTGWPERQAWFEAVDWTGIDLRLFGNWPHLSASSPLRPFVTEMCIDNLTLPAWYAATKIALNLHRADQHAESLNPRAYELAACGTYQISDPRAEGRDIFGSSIAWVETPADLEHEIRHALAEPHERQRRADLSRQAVSGCTFDHRAADLLAAFQHPSYARAMAG